MCWICDMFTSIFGKKEEKPKEEVVKPKTYLFSKEDLYKINGGLNKNDCDYYYEALNEVMQEYQINTPLRISHFLAQILHESGHFKYKSENLNYSAAGLRKTFPKYFTNDVIANQYARKPEKIANRVYANRMGNGNEASDDGFAFRGRGLIQLTGKDNYTKCGQDLNIDLVKNPDLITSDPVTCVKTACWFWNKNKLNTYADNDDIKTITRKINGGVNGLDSRTLICNIAKGVLNK